MGMGLLCHPPRPIPTSVLPLKGRISLVAMHSI
jgi:hypothetical protein